MTLLYLATHKHPWEHGEAGPRSAMNTAPGLSSGLRALLRAMTTPEPSARISDGKRAREALEKLLKPARSMAGGILAAAAALVLVAAGGGVAYFTSSQRPQPAPVPIVKLNPPTPVPPIPDIPKPPVPTMEKPPIFIDAALGQAHRCFTRAVPRVLQSRWRYLSWVNPLKGPTGREQHVYGLYAGYDDAITQCDFSSENAPESIRAQVKALADVTREAIPLLKAADRYYSEARYKDDDAKGAREYHPKLMHAFDAILTTSQPLEKALFEMDLTVLKDAAVRHQDRPLLRDATKLLLAYHHIAAISPSWGDEKSDPQKLLAALQDAITQADALEAAREKGRGDLTDAEATAVDAVVNNSSKYRSQARYLRDGRGDDKSVLSHDPMDTRMPFLDLMVEIFLWSEVRR